MFRKLDLFLSSGEILGDTSQGPLCNWIIRGPIVVSSEVSPRFHNREPFRIL